MFSYSFSDGILVLLLASIFFLFNEFHFVANKKNEKNELKWELLVKNTDEALLLMFKEIDKKEKKLGSRDEYPL